MIQIFLDFNDGRNDDWKKVLIKIAERKMRLFKYIFISFFILKNNYLVLYNLININ